MEHQKAEKPQRENIVRQLTKLGNTPYECADVNMPADFDGFIPSSLLAELRRQLVTKLSATTVIPAPLMRPAASMLPIPPYPYSYLYNIANSHARDFYAADGISAYELEGGDGPLMQCRHCLRYSLGRCVRHGGQQPTWHEPLYLRLGDGRRFRLDFDCRHCQMNVYASNP